MVKNIRTLILMIILFILSLSPGLFGATRHDKAFDIGSDGLLDYSLKTNKYEQYVEHTKVTENRYLLSLSDFTQVSSNSKIELYYRPSDLAISILSKESGYVWSSVLNTDYNRKVDGEPLYPELYSDSNRGFNTTWSNRVKTPITISYYTPTNNLVEETIFKSTSTSITTRSIVNGFSSLIYFGESGIKLTMNVTIVNNELLIDIPSASIVEGENLLCRVVVYQFLGATKGSEIEGYTFIPDGSGALVRFEGGASNTLFSKRFYNTDYGVTSSYTFSSYGYEESSINCNMYGIVQGVDEHAMMSIIDGGAYNAYLNMYPATNTTDFWFTYPQFFYRYQYIQYLNKDKTIFITKITNERFDFDIRIREVFLDNEKANYVGFAEAYREYLLEKGSMIERELDLQTPMNITTIGAEMAQGAIFNKKVVMTTFDNLRKMIDELVSSGLNNYSVSYWSWNKNGYSGNYKKHEGDLGTRKELKELIANYHVYLDEQYVWVDSKKNNVPSRDIVKSLNGLNVQSGNWYVLSSSRTIKDLKNSYNSVSKKYGESPLSLSGVGYNIYSNFGSTKETREEVLKTYINELKKIKTLSLYMPLSDFFFADEMRGVKLTSSEWALFTDSVPFLQILLSGYSNLYSDYLNFFSIPNIQLLRLVDYNTSPSVILTYNSSYDLLNTEYSYVYSSRYEDWKDMTIYSYNYVKEALDSGRNSTIVKREVLGTGVYKNTYSNGSFVIINYTNSTFSYGGINIPKASYYTGVGL